MGGSVALCGLRVLPKKKRRKVPDRLSPIFPLPPNFAAPMPEKEEQFRHIIMAEASFTRPGEKKKKEKEERMIITEGPLAKPPFALGGDNEGGDGGRCNGASFEQGAQVIFKILPQRGP